MCLAVFALHACQSVLLSRGCSPASMQGSGGTVDPASLSSGNADAAAKAVEQGVQGAHVALQPAELSCA